jgi:anti-sigma regulatory factor (Ser/Thr protein kinase)
MSGSRIDGPIAADFVARAGQRADRPATSQEQLAGENDDAQPAAPNRRGLSRRESAHASRLAQDEWLPTVVRHSRIDLAGGVHAGSVARRAIREQFGEIITPDEQDMLRVLVTELVNNAVLHGGADDEHHVVVHLAVAPERLRGEVCDEGPGLDLDALPSCAEVGGNGFILVDCLASRWGVATDAGTCVWFELDRRADPRSGAGAQ